MAVLLAHETDIVRGRVKCCMCEGELSVYQLGVCPMKTSLQPHYLRTALKELYHVRILPLQVLVGCCVICVFLGESMFFLSRKCVT